MNSKAYIGRINADVFRILTLALREMNNEGLGDVHILRAEVSPDLSTARIFVNGGVEMLNGSQGFFRNAIAQNLNIRRVPMLKFIVDSGEDNAKRVEELLKQIKQSN